MGDIPSEICRILLVDDHKLLMEGVRSLLAPYGHLRVVGMAQNGGEAGALAEAVRFAAEEDGERVFTGVVDEVCCGWDEDGARLSVSGRPSSVTTSPSVTLLMGVEQARHALPFSSTRQAPQAA